MWNAHGRANVTSKLWNKYAKRGNTAAWPVILGPELQCLLKVKEALSIDFAGYEK